MSLRTRSILVALAALSVFSAGVAQPQPGGTATMLETITAARRDASTGSLTRSLTAFDALVDPARLTAWDPAVQLARLELVSHLHPRINLDAPLEAFIQSYGSSPHAPYAQIRRGLGALQRNEHGQARLWLNEAVQASSERDVDNIDETAAGTAQYWLGIAHLTDPDATLRAQAAAALRASTEEYPRNPYADDACFALGQMHEESGELDTAIAYYDRLIERYPSSEHRLVAALRAAQCNLRLDRILEARQQLAAVSSELAATPADAERHALQVAEYHLLVAATEEYAGDYVAAERSYLAVIYSLDSPYRRAALLGLADTYRAAGQHDSATAIFRRIVARDRRDQAGMYADYQLAVAGLAPPYAPETLTAVSSIASDSAHAMTWQARLTLAGIHYLRQEFTQTAQLLDAREVPANRPALRSKTLLLRGVNRLALMRYREADNDLAQALRIARATPIALMPERDSVVKQAALAGSIAMIHSSRPSDAVPQLNRLLQSQPSDAVAAEATFWLGEAYYASGVLPASVQTMEDLIERYPVSTRIEDALHAIGWAQLHQRKLDRAEAAFSRLVKAYPLTVYATEAHLRRGDCLYLMRKYAQAAEAYQLADSAGAHPELLEYARYQTALARFHDSKRDEARHAFAHFVELYPRSELADDAQFMTGLVEYMERRYDGAVAAFSSLDRQYAGSNLIARARTMMSASYYALGNYDSARTIARSVVDRYPESAYAGEAQAALERADAALHELAAKLARDDRRVEGLIDKAIELREGERFPDALEQLSAAHALARDNEALARVTLEIARTHMLAHDTASGVDALRGAASLPMTPSGRLAQWSLADYYRAQHMSDSALVYYSRIATVDTTSVLALLRVGQSHLDSRNWTDAITAFSAVIAARSSHAAVTAEAHLGTAAAHAAQGDIERAREIFEQVIRERADDDVTRRAEQQLRELGNL